MLKENFEKIYRNFRLNVYKRIFEIMGENEGSLTATEFFAAETAELMDGPTISEFADFLSITSSHAAYKVRQLAEKGYIEKTPTADKRTYRLKVTDKFEREYHSRKSYGSYVFDILSESLTAEELAAVDRLFEKFVKTIDGLKK